MPRMLIRAGWIVLVALTSCGGIVRPDGGGGEGGSPSLPAPTAEPTASFETCPEACEPDVCEEAHCLDGACAVFTAPDGTACPGGVCTAGACAL